jgi:hypothetical protein
VALAILAVCRARHRRIGGAVVTPPAPPALDAASVSAAT